MTSLTVLSPRQPPPERDVASREIVCFLHKKPVAVFLDGQRRPSQIDCNVEILGECSSFYSWSTALQGCQIESSNFRPAADAHSNAVCVQCLPLSACHEEQRNRWLSLLFCFLLVGNKNGAGHCRPRPWDSACKR